MVFHETGFYLRLCFQYIFSATTLYFFSITASSSLPYYDLNIIPLLDPGVLN